MGLVGVSHYSPGREPVTLGSNKILVAGSAIMQIGAVENIENVYFDTMFSVHPNAHLP